MPRNVLLLKGNYMRAAGPETVLRTMIDAIDRRRVEPVMVMLRKDGVAGAPVLEQTESRIRWRELRWPGIAAAWLAARKLAQIVRDEAAELIHTHDMRANLAAYFLKKFTGVPWVAHVHGYLGHTHTWRYRLYEKLDQFLVRAADLVLVGSHATGEEVRNAGANNVKVIHYGVPIPPADAHASEAAKIRRTLGCDQSTVLIGITGRVHPGKGQLYVVKAIGELVRQGLPVHGLIVGEGPDLAMLKDLARQLKIEDRITFTGFVEDARPYLAAMDVFVVASLKESLPQTFLEATAMGKAIVSSAVGDLPLAIEDGASGMLVPPADAEALTVSLAWLVRDPELRKRIGRRAREVGKAQFSAEAMTRQIESAYESVLEARHAA